MRLIRRTILLPITMALTVLLVVSMSSETAATQEQTPTRNDVQSALEEAVAAGVPGIALAIRTPEGGEFLTAGDASLETVRKVVLRQ